MDRDRLVVGLAAVFAGLTVLLVVVALAKQPFLLLFAIPFGATTYFLWYHASGRLEARARSRVADPRQREEPRFRTGRSSGSDPRSRFADGNRGGRTRDGTGGADAGIYAREAAYRTLGLEPGASEDAVRKAYRSRVKRVHPDTETGDEERFKAVNRAYELLTE